MSHILVRKIVGAQYEFAGREWWYQFGPEITALDVGKLKSYASKTMQPYSEIAKSWNDEMNTEWVCRVFSSAKMIMASSVMLTSLKYASEKNLKICVPYLQYYAVQYALKALVLMLPDQSWDKGGLIQCSHTHAINVACNEINRVDPKWSNQGKGPDSIKNQILKLKAYREYISYRAPSSGGNLKEYEMDVLSLCRESVELAQMKSELFEEALGKHCPSDYEPRLLDEDLECVCSMEIEGEHFFDNEDAYRIGYLFRKYPFPTNILHIMSEGHVEDFFGSWCDEDDREDVYDPDDDCRILFDVP